MIVDYVPGKITIWREISAEIAAKNIEVLNAMFFEAGGAVDEQ